MECNLLSTPFLVLILHNLCFCVIARCQIKQNPVIDVDFFFTRPITPVSYFTCVKTVSILSVRYLNKRTFKLQLIRRRKAPSILSNEVVVNFQHLFEICCWTDSIHLRAWQKFQFSTFFRSSDTYSRESSWDTLYILK